MKYFSSLTVLQKQPSDLSWSEYRAHGICKHPLYNVANQA